VVHEGDDVFCYGERTDTGLGMKRGVRESIDCREFAGKGSGGEKRGAATVRRRQQKKKFEKSP